MEFDLIALAKRINKLDTYYEMSDDYRKINAGTEEENAIAHWLNGMEDKEVDEVVYNLDQTGLINYNRYFKKFSQ